MNGVRSRVDALDWFIQSMEREQEALLRKRKKSRRPRGRPYKDPLWRWLQELEHQREIDHRIAYLHMRTRSLSRIVAAEMNDSEERT